MTSRVLAPIPLVAPAKTQTSPEDWERSAAKAALLCRTTDNFVILLSPVN